MEKKRLAIVILNWNGAALMEQFLPILQQCTPEEYAEIIVADNGSTDCSLKLLKEKFPTVGIIELDHNYGFADGYNKAIAQINHEYIVLLNSDVEVSPGWVKAPMEILDAHPEIAALQPKLRAQRQKDSFEYAGAAGGFIDQYGYPYCRGRVMDIVEKDKGQYDTEADLMWATGACLFIRTNVYKDEGGLDSGFFAHQEEIDLCWRLRCRGYRIVCCPRSVVYHVGGATLNAENPRKTFLNFRNNLLMLYKNLPENRLHSVMRIRTVLDYIAALKFLFTGQYRNAKAVRDARKAYHTMLPEYKNKREENLRKSKVPMPAELRRKSLLISFYLKRKKTFDQL